MTVLVKTEGFRLKIPVPLAVLRLLPLAPGMPADMDREIIAALHRALRQARRDFRGLELVHVRSVDGDEVIIRL